MPDAWTIRPSNRAERDLRGLDARVARRIVQALERFAETEAGDVRRLTDVEPPEWRLRVGDWRVRFRYDYNQRVIEVLRVLHRSDAY